MQSRRGRGEGSITKRKDGRWMGRLDLGWRDGKRQTKTIYGRTRKEVSLGLADSNKAARDGTLVLDDRQTVGQFLARWVEDVARPRVRPRTLATYVAAIERHITPYVGRTPLAKFTPQAVQAWLRSLEDAGVSPNRRRYARVVLRMALNTAIRWNLVTRNVATLVDAPRVIGREIQPLNPEQARMFLSAADGHPLEAFFTVALACGLRLGEALGLQWDDVDLHEGRLSVRRAIQRFGGDAAKRRPLLVERKRLLAQLRPKGEEPLPVGEALQAARLRLVEVRKELAAVKTSVQIVEPKSNRSKRTIALPAMVLNALSRHRVRQLEARMAAGERWNDSGFVFTTPNGTVLDARNVTRAFKALLASRNLPAIRLHDLRHSCATLMLAQGVSPRVVMETLGHSQISLTLNTYSHVLPAMQDDAASKMDAILQSANG